MGAGSARDALYPLASVRYVSDEVGCDLVSVSVEGRAALLAFEPDAPEHGRRRRESLTLMPSRRLLHALWSLPRQVPWPMGGLDEVDAETLRSEGLGHVLVEPKAVMRLYQPPGRVRAVVVKTRRLQEAVARVGQFPPIYGRYAIATQASASDGEAVTIAVERGIGTVVGNSGGLEVHSEPSCPQRGVPGVYRWWLAELAYREWRQASAH